MSINQPNGAVPEYFERGLNSSVLCFKGTHSKCMMMHCSCACHKADDPTPAIATEGEARDYNRGEFQEWLKHAHTSYYAHQWTDEDCAAEVVTLWQCWKASRSTDKPSPNPHEGERSELHYAVEYLLHGESKWRRTMDQPLEEGLKLQELELWQNRNVTATKCIAYCEQSRLLTKEELAKMEGSKA